MAARFPIVIEREAPGLVSAYVAGVPVYAQGATIRGAERALQRTLVAYLAAHPETRADVAVKVATVRRVRGATPRVTIVSAAALLGGRTSRRKAASSRANGRLGGRPRRRRVP